MCNADYLFLTTTKHHFLLLNALYVNETVPRDFLRNDFLLENYKGIFEKQSDEKF